MWLVNQRFTKIIGRVWLYIKQRVNFFVDIHIIKWRIENFAMLLFFFILLVDKSSVPLFEPRSICIFSRTFLNMDKPSTCSGYSRKRRENGRIELTNVATEFFSINFFEILGFL